MDGERMCEMTQGISDKEIENRLKGLAKDAKGWDAPISSMVGWRELVNLRDARAELAELKRFSASQEEAHALRDAGASL